MSFCYQVEKQMIRQTVSDPLQQTLTTTNGGDFEPDGPSKQSVQPCASDPTTGFWTTRPPLLQQNRQAPPGTDGGGGCMDGRPWRTTQQERQSHVRHDDVRHVSSDPLPTSLFGDSCDGHLVLAKRLSDERRGSLDVGGRGTGHRPLRRQLTLQGDTDWRVDRPQRPLDDASAAAASAGVCGGGDLRVIRLYDDRDDGGNTNSGSGEMLGQQRVSEGEGGRVDCCGSCLQSSSVIDSFADPQQVAQTSSSFISSRQNPPSHHQQWQQQNMTPNLACSRLPLQLQQQQQQRCQSIPHQPNPFLMPNRNLWTPINFPPPSTTPPGAPRRNADQVVGPMCPGTFRPVRRWSQPTLVVAAPPFGAGFDDCFRPASPRQAAAPWPPSQYAAGVGSIPHFFPSRQMHNLRLDS